jgi:ParB/RepB/Spo0J family partition protein
MLMYGIEDRLIDVHLIRPPAQQLREAIDPDSLGALADDIAARGLLQRVGVRGPMGDGTFEIVWGHRRWLAVKSLGHREIATRVFPPEFDPLLASVSENLQREQLSPLEEARLVTRLLDSGMSGAETARQLRRTLEWVRGRAHLAGAPEDIQRAVHEGVIPLGVGYALMAIDHEGYRQELIEQARRLGATIAVAQVWVAEYARDRVQLIRSHEGVSEIIRRAQAIQATTTCLACLNTVAWSEVETLRLCPTCYRMVEAVLFAGEAESPPATP